MKSTNQKYLKSSFGRKSIHLISSRQRRNIRRKLQQTLAKFSTLELPESINLGDNVVRTKSKSVPEGQKHSLRCVPEANNTIPYCSFQTLPHISATNDNDILCIPPADTSLIEDEYSGEASVQLSDMDVSDAYNNVQINDNRNTFQDQLAKCFASTDISHQQSDAILAVLRNHTCLSYLPKSTKTLLQTPTTSIQLRSVFPGEYLHIGFEKAIIKIIRRASSELIPEFLKVDFHTDGAREDNSGRIQMWPIQCHIVNIPRCKPEPLGIYRGCTKPKSADDFFKDFVDETMHLREKGGISYNGNIVPFEFRAFIADAPARAFVLNHYGHMSSNPCSKCKVTGERCLKRNLVYTSVTNDARTDDEYAARIDEDHHKDGGTPLTSLLSRIVAQTPFEYMHLVLLGIVKKMLRGIIHGKYGKKVKLPSYLIDTMSRRLQVIASYCPREFSRRPRPISEYVNYKATEFRQFLFYTGVVVLLGIVNDVVYKHFLLLHAIMRCLARDSLSEKLYRFCEIASKIYIEESAVIYGTSFVSYNVHGFLHLVEDARSFGSVDNFSAFKYENNMTFYRKSCRKLSKQLQQIVRRAAEKEKFREKAIDDVWPITPKKEHTNGPCPGSKPTCRQYKQLQTDKMHLTITQRDNCCILNGDTICLIQNILVEEGTYYLVVKKFYLIENFYKVGITSSSVGVFKCSNLSTKLYTTPLLSVRSKCYRMPIWNGFDADDSDGSGDESDHELNGQYVVVVMS